ncbi:MAG: hypothetical protein QOD86_615 [Miltoncostaeaceae bacterium]|jgi:predicted small lipoprotein YifL|nr:hypothetical protein [Miltoncostaeaceae bacterium]
MRLVRGAALAAVIALVAALGGCGEDAGPPVALPPADAPPAAVARAYVEALDRSDLAALRELTTRNHFESAIHWLSNLRHIRIAEMRPAHRDDAVGSAVRHPDVVIVPVELDLDLGDPGLSGFSTDGRTTWGYVLVRDAPTDRWRVDDEGT